MPMIPDPLVAGDSEAEEQHYQEEQSPQDWRRIALDAGNKLFPLNV